MRSSMSRNDMWQPEQPSSQTVASVGFWLPCISLIAFASHHRQVRQKLPPLGHFGHGPSFLAQRAGGADMHAFAATGTALRFAPRLGQDSDDHAIGAASDNVPGVRAFDLVAHADA